MKKLFSYLSIIFHSFIHLSLRAQSEVHSIGFISGDVGTQTAQLQVFAKYQVYGKILLLYSVALHGVTLSSYGQILS